MLWQSCGGFPIDMRVLSLRETLSATRGWQLPALYVIIRNRPGHPTRDERKA
jgi:hypothetical protein